MFPEEFLRIGDIGVDIGINTVPVITANYIESYHKVKRVSQPPTNEPTHSAVTDTHTQRLCLSLDFEFVFSESSRV